MRFLGKIKDKPTPKMQDYIRSRPIPATAKPVPGPGYCLPCDPCPEKKCPPHVAVVVQPKRVEKPPIAIPALEKPPLQKALDARDVLTNFTSLAQTEPVFDPKPAVLRRAADAQGLSPAEANRSIAEYAARKQAEIDHVSDLARFAASNESVPITDSNLLTQELKAFAPALEKCVCPPGQIRIQRRLSGPENGHCWAGLLMLGAIAATAFAINRIT